jgi:hypothetical protein
MGANLYQGERLWREGPADRAGATAMQVIREIAQQATRKARRFLPLAVA